MVLLETSSYLLFLGAINCACLKNLDLSLIMGLWDAHTMMWHIMVWLTLHSEWEHASFKIHQEAFLKEHFAKNTKFRLQCLFL